MSKTISRREEVPLAELGSRSLPLKNSAPQTSPKYTAYQVSEDMFMHSRPENPPYICAYNLILIR